MPTTKNNQLILWVLGAFLLIGIVIYLISVRSYQIGPTQSLDTTGQTINGADEQSLPQNENYQDYSEEAFLSARDQRRVLFFYASWCPTCRPLHREISENTNQIPDDVVIFRTDYDTSTELKQKYGVTYQHTFVQVDREGEKLKIWNGGDMASLLDSILVY